MSQIDRLSIREHPSGSPIMYQTWGKLLFMHWPIPADLLRPLIPQGLEIDLFDGTAWVGMTPFTMWDVRPVFLPALPGLSEAHELNVRTYVHFNGVPGVWFFSLDANHALAVLGARLMYHLPYFTARMSLKQQDQTIAFTSTRTDSQGPPAEFEATWKIGEALGEAEPESRDFFLIERYCLYAADGDQLYRARIWHRPWPLQSAELQSCRSSMIESHGLPSPQGGPLVHYAEELKVSIWPLAEV